MLELSDVRHVKVSMTKKARSQFVMFAFLSTNKRSWQKTQTVTWTFDCFSLQIAFSLSGKVIVILKAPPSHSEVGLKGNKQRIRLNRNSLIVARKIALVR